MQHLLKCELSRFRLLAIAFALAHLAALRLSMVLNPLFAQEAAKIAVALLSYTLLGLIFGLYQMSTYRRSHLWAWLMNRPLEPRQIFFSLAGAAAVLSCLVVVAPLFLMTLYSDFLTAQWVDARHYLMMPFLFGLVMFAYFLGAFIATSPRRASFMVAVLAAFFLTREALGQWIFVPLTLALAWMAYLAFQAFRPDLGAPEKRPLTLLAATLPLAYAIFWLVSRAVVTTRSLGIIFYEHGPRGLSTFAWNDYWDEGNFPHVGYQDERDAMAHGLRLASTERSQAFLQQLDLADVFEPWGPRFHRFPRRHQLFFNDHRHQLVDEENEVYWTFSHDQMLFSGRNMRTNKAVGWMARDGLVTPHAGTASPFSEVPFVVDSKWLVFSRQIFEIDFKLQRIDLRFELPEGEKTAMSFNAHRSFVIALSDQRFYLFDPRHFELERGILEPLASFELPGEERNLSRLQVAEMIDSYLISFVFGSQSFRGFHEAHQVVIDLSIDGDPQVIADLPLVAGFPDWYRRRGFILSPLIQHGHDLAWTAIGPNREERVSASDIRSRPVPARIAVAAALMTLLSVLITWALVEKRRLTGSERRFWLLMALLLGFPGALVCTLLTVREESSDAAAFKPSARAVAPTANVGSLEGQQGWSA